MIKSLNPHLVHISKLLSDLAYHDGDQLGASCQISRSAVWKMIKKLQAYGVEVDSVMGKGYRLQAPLLLLDVDQLTAAYADKTIKLFESLPSSNQYLMQHTDIAICLTEHQQQGKGRMARQWHSPFADNIYLSMAFHSQQGLAELSGISLALACAICQAIEQACQLEEGLLQVKWPNDIYYQDKKLAGILLEVQAEAYGVCRLIIGLGLNVNMQQAANAKLNQAWTSLFQLKGHYIDRNPLVIALIQVIEDSFFRYQNKGLAAFLAEWQKRDCLYGHFIQLQQGKQVIKGVMQGIDGAGRLLLADKNGQQAFASGDASKVRAL